MNELNQNEEALFEAALEFPTTERNDYLGKACGADTALRQRVEALLRAHDRAFGVLEKSAAAALRETLLPSTDLSEKPGDRIGRYRLLQQIGEGGCGVVYMAEQEEPVRRRVALKIIKLGMDTRQVIARFEAERQVLALMDHPNIAKVHDAGATETGRPFFVMELVRGVRITDYCDEANLPTEQRLALFVQVCQAIQHAHQKGIIHRDIKPSNILVTMHDGVPVPKVIDFGIAKATTDQRLTDKTLFTAFEQFVGTPAYMSPEQAERSGLDIDTRSDIYSLGVLLYEFLTGRTPLDGRELLATGLDEMRRTIREREPLKPSTRLSRLLGAELTATANRRQTEAPKLIHLVRGGLDWIVMKALEKDRTRRYETANGLALDVQRHLKNEPVAAGPPSNMYRLQKLVQRNRLAFAAAATVAVTILLALAFLVVSNVRTIRERNQKNLALHEKAAALDAAKASEQRAKEELFEALRSQAQARRYSRQMGQRLESLAAVMEASRLRVDATLRDEAIAAMALPDVRRGPSWQVSRTNCVALACDAMRQRFAVLDRAGVVTVRSLADDRELRRFEVGRNCDGCYTRLAFSPDGRFLIKVDDEQSSHLWLLESGDEIFLQNAPAGLSEPAFSADGRLLALAGWDNVHCFELPTGREVSHWKTGGHIHSLQFHPADTRLAVAYKTGPQLSIYDAVSGRELSQLDVGEAWRMVTSWHPGGKTLAVGSTALGIQIWDVDAPRRLARLESHAREVDYLSFHPAGDWLVSWNWDDVMEVWDAATGRQALRIPMKAELRFSRDGRWLGSFWPGAEQAQLLELVAPLGYSTLRNDSWSAGREFNACAVSPDDRFVAAAMDDDVRVWDLKTRREVALIPSGVTTAVSFAPDGRTLWTSAYTNGLQRWAFPFSPTNHSGLPAGVAQPGGFPFAPTRFSSDNAVRRLAVVNKEDGRIAVLDASRQFHVLLAAEHPLADVATLSPDGKWLATSGWHSEHCRLWDAETGAARKDLTVGKETWIGFTPDNRELIVARNDEYQFLSLATFQTTRRFARQQCARPGDVSFSPDEKLMAMEMSPAVIHLKEAATGRTVAQLEDPSGDRSSKILFSHDGMKLIVVSGSASAIHVWDLRAIRSGLKAMALDWDWPEFPPAPANP